MVPGDDAAAAQLPVHAEGAHFPLQSVPELLARLQVPDEVGPGVVQLEPAGREGEKKGCEEGKIVSESERSIQGGERRR